MNKQHSVTNAEIDDRMRDSVEMSLSLVKLVRSIYYRRVRFEIGTFVKLRV